MCKLSTKVLPCLALWKYVYGNRYFRTKVRKYESTFVLSKVLLPYFVCTKVLSKVLSYKVRSYVRVQTVRVQYMYLHTLPHEGKILILCVSLWTAGLKFIRARRTIRHAEPLHSPRYPVFVSLTQDVSFSSDDFSCVDCRAHCCRPHNSGSHGFPRQPA